MTTSRPRRLRIAVICPDLEGPIRNGGVGTANTALANLCAEEGHELHLLLTTRPERQDGDWKLRYDQAGIRTYDAEDWSDANDVPVLYPNHPDVRGAYIAFLWAQDIAPDLIIVPDWKGHGFFVATAQLSTPVLVVAHGPSMWHDLGSFSLPTHPDEILRYYLERKSLECADAVVSPSQYMVDWLAQHGYKTRRSPVVIPNPVTDHDHACSELPGQVISGVAFFGRLEERKGLRDFCDALDLLSSDGRLPSRIDFVGKFGLVGGRPCDEYLAERLTNWDSDIQLLTDFDSATAVSHIARSNSLAVIPSLVDNSPYTIVETVRARIPFLARDVGGVGELLDANTRDIALYVGGAPALAEAIHRRLNHGPVEQGLALDPATVAARWLAQVERVAALPSRPRTTESALSISVCLVHHDRPTLVKQAVASLLAQTDPDFEVVLVDDGSAPEARAALRDLEPIFEQKRWKIIYSANQYLGAARNLAASHANGDYLLFMDDDNVANSSLIGAFRSAASQTDADFIACAFDVFEEPESAGEGAGVLQERFVPLGPTWAECASRNVLGDANSLIRAATFERAGGFTEDRGIGSEDYELFTRLMIREAGFALVPEPLFRYRRHEQSMSLQTSQLASESRRVRPFVEELPAHWHEVVLAARLARPLQHGIDTTTRGGRWNGLPSDLIARGRCDVARSVLKDWNPVDDDAVAGKLGLQILDRLLAGDSGMLLGDRADMNLAADRVLRALRDALGAVRRLEHPVDGLLAIAAEVGRQRDATPTAHVEVLAQLVLIGINDGATMANFQVLGQAIGTASSAYASRRPDIASSIDGLHVVSSLDHYDRWGADEAVDWPEMDTLVAALPGSRSNIWDDFRALAPAPNVPELERFLRTVARAEL